MKRTLIPFMLLLVLSSCVGAAGNVRFDSLKYPASMSPALYDSDGKILYYNRQLKPVEKLEYTKTIWSMFWSLLVFNPDQDLSEPVNKKIEESGGVGLVNLTVRSSGCGLNYFPFLNILPIWPGCTSVTIKGDVVKRDVKEKK